MQNELYRAKMAEKQGFSLSTSKEENELYEILAKNFPSIQRFHKHPVLYPFNCDFFIPEKMLFIEYQGSQYHHGSAYNPNCMEDVNEVDKLNEIIKLNNEKSSFAEAVLHTWLEVDPNKRRYAMDHDTNLYEIWPKYNIDKVIKDISNFENISEYETINQLNEYYVNEITNWLTAQNINYSINNDVINVDAISIKFMLLCKNNEIYCQGKDIIKEKTDYFKNNKNLIYIWEDEWTDTNKNEIIKSRILSKLHHKSIIK